MTRKNRRRTRRKSGAGAADSPGQISPAQKACDTCGATISDDTIGCIRCAMRGEQRFELLIVVVYALIAALVVTFMSLDLPAHARYLIPPGIAVGAWVTARTTGRIGVDVWMPPILTGGGLCMAALVILGQFDMQGALRSLSLAAVALTAGQFCATGAVLLAERLKR